MSKSVNLGKGLRFVSVILGTLIGGFIWRCRGQGGWGSFWGLCAVGTVLTLLVYAFYGSKPKMKYELIPVGVFMLSSAVTGYGTLLMQPAGFVTSDVGFGGAEGMITAPVSVKSGIAIMLLMGFTLAPLFAFFVCSLFSEKEYNILHYLSVIAVYYAISLLMKAYLSHYIMIAINPEQVRLAAKGLASSGINLTPMQAYLRHFNSRNWAEDFAFCENYFMSIESVSNAAAALGVFIYVFTVFRDRIASVGAFIINTIMAVGTTFWDGFNVIRFDTGILANVTPPRPLIYGSWGLWEFFTGASLGFGIMTVLALLPKKYTVQGSFKSVPMIKNKYVRYLYFLLTSVFIAGVVPFRAVGLNAGEILEEYGVVKDDDTVGLIIIIAASVVIAAVFAAIYRKNIIARNLPVPFPEKPKSFALDALPLYLLLTAVIYFCIAIEIWKYRGEFAGVDSIRSFLVAATSPAVVVNSFMAAVAVVITVIGLPVRKALKKTVK